MIPTPPTAARDAAPTASTGPLTDPAELFALIGRMGACFFLFLVTITSLLRHAWVLGLAIAIFSLFYQRSTLRMWRRLRDARLAAEAARSGVTIDPTEAA